MSSLYWWGNRGTDDHVLPPASHVQTEPSNFRGFQPFLWSPRGDSAADCLLQVVLKRNLCAKGLSATEGWGLCLRDTGGAPGCASPSHTLWSLARSPWGLGPEAPGDSDPQLRLLLHVFRSPSFHLELERLLWLCMHSTCRFPIQPPAVSVIMILGGKRDYLHLN